MAHPQQGDTRVGDDGVHWVFDGGIWRGDHAMYTPCPVTRSDDGYWFQTFPAAATTSARRHQRFRRDGTLADYYATDDEG